MNNNLKFAVWILVTLAIIISILWCGMLFGVEDKEESSEQIIDTEIQKSIEYLVHLDKAQELTRVERSEVYLLTAYCPCIECSEGYGDMTATGKRAVEGRTIAVDPKIIPYGTELYIDGVGYRVAEDCGGYVNGKHIDIYFDCHSKVDAFGKKYAEVEI